jgi:hypothetical protein
MEATDLMWRKSTYSSDQGGDCVEVGHTAGTIAVRDTTNRDGGTLAFSAAAWSSFTASLR